MIPLNIAHRGARSLAPENTLPAAEKALEVGADMWEFDVGLTADGEMILIHDDTLERTSNVAEIFPDRAPWALHTFTLAEIRQLDFGTWFKQTDPFEQIAAGQVSTAALVSYTGVQAPTLAEALTFTHEQKWRANVEIKDMTNTPNDAHGVEKIVALVESMMTTEQVIISSFNHDYLKRVKIANSIMPIGALIYQPIDNPLALVQTLGASAYHPRKNLIDAETITDLHQHGVAVNVWTVNDEALLRHFIGAKVDGIMTDFPQRLDELGMRNEE